MSHSDDYFRRGGDHNIDDHFSDLLIEFEFPYYTQVNIGFTGPQGVRFQLIELLRPEHTGTYMERKLDALARGFGRLRDMYVREHERAKKEGDVLVPHGRDLKEIPYDDSKWW